MPEEKAAIKTPEAKPAVQKPAATKTGDVVDINANKTKRVAREAKPKFPDDHKIYLLNDAEGKKYGPDNNPKRRGAGERFAKYRDGITVKEVTEAKGGPNQVDLRWDKDKGFVDIRPA